MGLCFHELRLQRLTQMQHTIVLSFQGSRSGAPERDAPQGARLTRRASAVDPKSFLGPGCHVALARSLLALRPVGGPGLGMSSAAARALWGRGGAFTRQVHDAESPADACTRRGVSMQDRARYTRHAL